MDLTNSSDSFELSINQKFELETQLRTIDSCDNLEELKSLSKQLCSALMTQKAATNWAIRQTLGEPPSLRRNKE